MYKSATHRAECWADHCMIHSKLLLLIQPVWRKSSCKFIRWLNVKRLQDEATQVQLCNNIMAALSDPAGLTTNAKVNSEWATFCNTVYQFALAILSTAKCCYQDWLDESDPEIQQWLTKKHELPHQILVCHVPVGTVITFRNLCYDIQAKPKDAGSMVQCQVKWHQDYDDYHKAKDFFGRLLWKIHMILNIPQQCFGRTRRNPSELATAFQWSFESIISDQALIRVVD